MLHVVIGILLLIRRRCRRRSFQKGRFVRLLGLLYGRAAFLDETACDWSSRGWFLLGVLLAITKVARHVLTCRLTLGVDLFWLGVWFWSTLGSCLSGHWRIAGSLGPGFRHHVVLALCPCRPLSSAHLAGLSRVLGLDGGVRLVLGQSLATAPDAAPLLFSALNGHREPLSPYENLDIWWSSPPVLASRPGLVGLRKALS